MTSSNLVSQEETDRRDAHEDADGLEVVGVDSPLDTAYGHLLVLDQVLPGRNHDLRLRLLSFLGCTKTIWCLDSTF